MPIRAANRWPYIGTFAAFALGYVALGAAAILAAGITSHITSIWVSNAVVFAILLRNEWISRLPALAGAFFGCFAINVLKGTEPLPSLVLSVAGIGYINALLLAVASVPSKGSADQNVVARYGGAIAAVTIVTLCFGMAVAICTSLMFGWSLADIFKHWSLTNLLGAALALPVALLVTAERFAATFDPTRVIKLVLWACACGAAMALALTYAQFPFAYIMIPLLVAAVCLSTFELSILCATSGTVALLVATKGTVVNLVESGQVVTPEFQFALAVNVLMPILVGLLIERTQSAGKQVAESHQRLTTVLKDSPIAVTSLDTQGNIIEANPAFGRMIGYDVSEIVGRNTREFSPAQELDATGERLARMQAGALELPVFQKRYQRRDGSMVWVEISTSVITGDDVGSQTYLVSHVYDINARKQAEEKLAEMEARWDFALASVGQGFWDHNLVDGLTTYSTTWTSLLGYRPGEMNGDASAWLDIVHPEDLPHVKEMDAAHQAGTIPHFELKYRMRHKDGSWVWVLDRGKVVERNPDGTPRRAIGTLTVIDEMKRAEEQLARTAALLQVEKERLRITLESIGDAVICTDGDDTVTFMNAAAAALTGVQALHGVGRKLRDVYDPTKGDHSRIGWADDRLDEFHSQIVRPDGTHRLIREVVTPIIAASGAHTGHVIVFHDVSDVQARHSELAHAAAHDVLTGLANRGAFLAAMDRLISETTAEGAPHQLLFIDLDRFKLINDTSGHAAGDAMLKLVGEAIQGSVRAEDMVSRLGGDEFAVILKNCPPSFARLVAQNIIDRVKSVELNWNESLHRVGASIGVADFAPSSSAKEVIARADSACYAAKDAGRGRVRIAPAQDATIVRLSRMANAASE